MNEDMIVVGAVLLFLLSRKKTAGSVPVMNPTTLAAANTRNMQSDMWARLLGSTWTGMVNGAVGSGALATNSAGQAVTGNGVPLSSGNPTACTIGYNDSGSYYGNYAADPLLIGGTDMQSGASDVYEGALLS